MNEHDGILEGWIIDPYDRRVVWGSIFGDSKNRFVDGAYIHTSTILEPEDLSTMKEGQIIKTRNSKYLLGAPVQNKGELASSLVGSVV